MKLVELLKKANEGYDDGYLSEYFNEETGELVEGKGDTLAQFIVIELSETFDADADDEDQIGEAIHLMQRAKSDIEGIMAALAK
jgi:hypothetical protein